MVALAVVAEINADNTILITKKLKITQKEFFPNLITNHKAKRLAACVYTNILAKTNDKILSHITG